MQYTYETYKYESAERLANIERKQQADERNKENKKSNRRSR